MKHRCLHNVMNLLEAERSAGNKGVVESVTQGPDILALWEQLAVLVSTGKSKEAIDARAREAPQRQRR